MEILIGLLENGKTAWTAYLVGVQLWLQFLDHVTLLLCILLLWGWLLPLGTDLSRALLIRPRPRPKAGGFVAPALLIRTIAYKVEMRR